MEKSLENYWKVKKFYCRFNFQSYKQKYREYIKQLY